ncbi:putative ribonuclease 3 [Tetrabaena socialis]|uniref:Putative ribonuclease 3 n=1 Tax=Tetrabaena socialis TaxID=47790 RepID=A0A2J8AJ38_9CHLO|nr:putative ribonuclease 3 [Tetrabaena socialis]|eukprot:PNH12524.1 putative ribonuclease 3 [Tetrabaena socialis]
MTSTDSTPFNPCNRLITPSEIHALLSKYGVADEPLDCAEYFKSMVHRSYCTRKNENFISGNLQCPANCLPLQEESNERLELLGDAVLNLVVAEYLFERFPTENEGFLTRMRSKIVNGHMLSELSLMVGLDKYVIISKQIEENDGRRNRKIMEDCFESFLGAMYLSIAFAKTRTWFVTFLEANVDVTELVLTQNNYKDMLAKYMQHNYHSAPKFSDDVGRSTSKFKVIVKNAKDVVVGSGTGPTRKMAEEDASKAALRYYGVSVYEAPSFDRGC